MNLPQHPAPAHPQLDGSPDDGDDPLYWPFRTLGDFEQTEFFVKNDFSDRQINEQLQLLTDHTKPQYHGSGISLLSSCEMHNLLHDASEDCKQPEVGSIDHWCSLVNNNFQFQSEKITVPYTHCGVVEDRTFIVRFQPALDAVCQVLEDPDVFESLTLYPEHRYIRKPGTQQDMRVWSEAWTGDDWWRIQVCPECSCSQYNLKPVQDKIGPDSVVVYIILYLDSTMLNPLGTKKAWPVQLWIGNISQRTRNS